MRTRYKVALFLLFITLAATLLVFVTKDANWGVLNPKGSIALQERNLMSFAAILMLVVAIPVFAMTLGIAWKYREGNKKAKYTPDWDHSVVAESIWWGIPCVIIVILATITWRSTHALDPFKAIASDKAPITIQVVALDWKWLFIYPEKHIATVNYIAIPKDTPINFQITADAPMNSFWIPQLGGQIYAMTGMSTQLHLMATENGTYQGVSANLSGKGFAGMKFDVQSVDAQDYDNWIGQELRNLGHHFQGLKRFPGVIRFLIAMFFFNDAVLTAADNFPIYIHRVFNLNEHAKIFLLASVLIMTGVGALISGYIVPRGGKKKVLLMLLASWVVMLPITALQKQLIPFIICMTLVGLLLGATGAVARTVMIYLSPRDELTHIFAYYSMTARLASFLGPLTWGLITLGLRGHGHLKYQVALAAMAVFVWVGYLLVRSIPEEQVLTI